MGLFLHLGFHIKLNRDPEMISNKKSHAASHSKGPLFIRRTSHLPPFIQSDGFYLQQHHGRFSLDSTQFSNTAWSLFQVLSGEDVVLQTLQALKEFKEKGKQ